MAHNRLFVLLLALCTSIGAAYAQLDKESIKKQAVEAYLKGVKEAEEKYGVKQDSATLKNQIKAIEENIDKQFSKSNAPTSKDSVVAETPLNANQCKLSDGTIYTIGYAPKEDGKSLLCVSLPLSDGVTLYTKKVPELKQALFGIAAKAREWAKTAKDNNVSNFTKEMPISLPKCWAAWTGVQLWTSNPDRGKVFFAWNNGGYAVAIGGYYRAILNEFIQVKGIYTWTNADDIEAVAKLIDESTLLNMYYNKKSQLDMFK